MRYKGDQPKINYAKMKDSSADKGKHPVEGFDISQRSTMMQGVTGPNVRMQSGSKHSQADITEMGITNKRSPLESDNDLIEAQQPTIRVRQQLQQLLLDENDEQVQNMEGEMDQMINKQSFSANQHNQNRILEQGANRIPIMLKMSNANNGGNQPAGNFMQVLCHYI